MLQRMLFQQFRSFTSKDQKMRSRRSMYIYGLFRSVLEVTRYSCTCVGVKRFQSLPQTMPFPREQLLTPLFR